MQNLSLFKRILTQENQIQTKFRESYVNSINKGKQHMKHQFGGKDKRQVGSLHDFSKQNIYGNI